MTPFVFAVAASGRWTTPWGTDEGRPSAAAISRWWAPPAVGSVDANPLCSLETREEAGAEEEGAASPSAVAPCRVRCCASCSAKSRGEGPNGHSRTSITLMPLGTKAARRRASSSASISSSACRIAAIVEALRESSALPSPLAIDAFSGGRRPGGNKSAVSTAQSCVGTIFDRRRADSQSATCWRAALLLLLLPPPLLSIRSAKDP